MNFELSNEDVSHPVSEEQQMLQLQKQEVQKLSQESKKDEFWAIHQWDLQYLKKNQTHHI